MTFRSPKLLRSAEGQPCANCGDVGTTVAAHANRVSLGKGTGIKCAEGFKMTSTGMMGFLVVFYIATAIVSGMEANWPRVLYWISAAGITTAVLWGTR